MHTTTLTYASADGRSRSHAVLWEPDGAALPDFRPRAVVQLVHGMAEHVGRYEPFAEFLVNSGFVVCGEDHVGHGRTAPSPEDLGHMPLRGGRDVLLADVHQLRRTVTGHYPDAPYAIFGHSMGSFVTRAYLTREGDGVAAAVICGTGQQPRLLSAAGEVIPRLIAAVRGERHRSRFIDSLGAGGFARKVADARTADDWIAADRAVVDAFRADDLCGRMFTVGAYATLSSLVADATSARLARRVPKGLPMLFVAGEGDPVGDFGRGVRRAADEYRAAGVKDVELVLYPGARHEILNESSCRDQVMADVLDYLTRRGL